MKVVTISSWLNFGRPAPPGRGSAARRKFLAPPYYSQRAVFASLRGLFSFRSVSPSKSKGSLLVTHAPKMTVKFVHNLLSYRMRTDRQTDRSKSITLLAKVIRWTWLATVNVWPVSFTRSPVLEWATAHAYFSTWHRPSYSSCTYRQHCRCGI